MPYPRFVATTANQPNLTSSTGCYAGKAHIARPQDPSQLSDAEWHDFLFVRTNPCGHYFERWRHLHGCGRFFNAVHETVSDRFLLTYNAGEPRHHRLDAGAGR